MADELPAPVRCIHACQLRGPVGHEGEVAHHGSSNDLLLRREVGPGGDLLQAAAEGWKVVGRGLHRHLLDRRHHGLMRPQDLGVDHVPRQPPEIVHGGLILVVPARVHFVVGIAGLPGLEVLHASVRVANARTDPRHWVVDGNELAGFLDKPLGRREGAHAAETAVWRLGVVQRRHCRARGTKGEKLTDIPLVHPPGARLQAHGLLCEVHRHLRYPLHQLCLRGHRHGRGCLLRAVQLQTRPHLCQELLEACGGWHAGLVHRDEPVAVCVQGLEGLGKVAELRVLLPWDCGS
mmetsp:Transcript_113108/g.365382  ORF Transcript_113108/g.365382 Transcript_113108/m.365382 type:complete len:292 (+) Transcript_113108:2172-3047(+)